MPELKRGLPLYSPLGFRMRPEAESLEAREQVRLPNPGLVFDRFVDLWDIDGDGRCRVQEPVGGKGSKRCWLEEVRDLYEQARNGIDANLGKSVERHRDMVERLGGACPEARIDWRFVSGIGNGHPYEAGFTWHRTLGVPYLPGSSVKGMLRAWADPEHGWGAAAKEEVRHLFGSTDEVGELIVFDALPMRSPPLKLDIMNPHYSAYYAHQAGHGEEAVPPADYLSPKPIFFLTVTDEVPFLFGLAPRRQGLEAEQDLERGLELLKDALATLGAGAKTAVGYGTMKLDHDALEQRRRELIERKLQEERQKYLDGLTPELRRVELLRERLDHLALLALSDRKESLRRDVAELLNHATRWKREDDRLAAAQLGEAVYEKLGWGSNERTALRNRQRIAALRNN